MRSPRAVPSRRRSDVLAAITKAAAVACARYRFEPLESRRLLAAGTLDPTFNGGVIVSTDMAGTLDEAHAVVVQPDGKIVVVGSASTDNNFGGDIIVFRYNANGTLDSSFAGGGGRIRIDFGAEEAAEAVALQPDGKIVLGGWSGDNASFDYDFVVMRLNADGTPDNTFGGGGVVFTDFGGNSEDRVHDLLIQPDGKIVAVGIGTDGNNMLGVARYTTTGALDGSFSGDGLLATLVNNNLSEGYAAVLQPDGKILVADDAASLGSGGGVKTIGITRINANGTVDTTFDFDGTVVHSVGVAAPQAIALAPDGGILVAATLQTSPAQTKVYKFSSTGALVTSFGTGGSTVISTGGSSSFPIGMKVMPSGRILVAATSSASGGSYGQWTVARLTSAGQFDSSFGTGGKTALTLDSQAQVSDLALQSDGKFVVAGYTNWNVGVARFTNDEPPAPATISGTRFEDRNADGVKQATDPGVAGSTVFLDLNNNGLLDGPGPGPGSPVTFNSGNVPLTIPTSGTINSTLNVSGFNYNVADLNVHLNINHTWDEDLDVFLISPTGTMVELFSDVGSNGQNFTNTVLDDEAATSITAGTAPFTATFRPEGLLSAFDGQLAQGQWILRITDDTSPDGGTLLGWAITITGAGLPGEPTTTTDAGGNYSFTNLAPGSYVVRDVSGSGQLRTIPAGGAHSINLAAGQNATGNNFGFFPTIFTGTSAADGYRVRREAANPTRLEIVGPGSVTWSAPASFVPSLAFNLLAGNDVLIVDLINGNPVPASGIAYDGGTHTSATSADGLWVFGSNADETVVVQNALVSLGTSQVSMPNVESVSFQDKGGNDTLHRTSTYGGALGFFAEDGFDTLIYDVNPAHPYFAVIYYGVITQSQTAHTTFSFVPESIVINGDAGAQHVEMANTPELISATLNMGGGNDLVEIFGNGTPHFTTDVGGGDDTVRFKTALAGMPTIAGGAGADTLDFAVGTHTLPADVQAWSFENLQTSGTADLSIAAPQHLQSFSLLDTSKARLASGGTRTVFSNVLSLAAGTLLDLNDNDLILTATPTDPLLQQLNAHVRTGRNAGAWDGTTGITSTNARNDVSRLTGLVVVPSASAVLLRYTWAADANGNRVVSVDDFWVVDRGFLARSSMVHAGDLNFSQRVDLDDYAMLDAGYLAQGAPLN